MQELFYISHDGQETGPFSVTEIIGKVKSGELWDVDYAYVEAVEDWVVINEYPLFAEHLHAVATPSVEVAAAAAPATAAAPRPPPIEPQQETENPQHAELPAESHAANAIEPAYQPRIYSPIDEVATPMDEMATGDAIKSVALAAVMVPAPATTESASSVVTLVNGVGTVDFTHFKAGRIRLTIEADGSMTMDTSANEVEIIAGSAQKLIISGPTEMEAGQNTKFELRAEDAFGNFAQGFNGRVTVTTTGSAHGGRAVELTNGFGEFEISDKLAESIILQLDDNEDTGLDVTCRHQIQVRPGKPTQFVIVAPKESMAGQPVTVQVKAMDAYGNLATHHGPLKLKVEAPDGRGSAATTNDQREASNIAPIAGPTDEKAA